MELDHVFIGCTPGAPEGDVLLEAGFAEGASNTHPGQGTRNRRFFFANAYLELLWVHDAREARSDLTRPTRLWERCSERAPAVCPFGLVFRPSREGERLPFATWSYRPEYLPRATSIEFAQGTSLAEPELVFLPFARPPAPSARSIPHRAAVRTIVGARVGMPAVDALTNASRAVEHLGIVTYFAAREHLLVLTSSELGSTTIDLTPGLPLRFGGVDS